MALPNRLRILVPCGVLTLASGLVAAWLSASSFSVGGGIAGTVAFVCSVVFAPVVLTVPWLRLWLLGATSIAPQTFLLALAAMLTFPTHVILARRWTAVMTIVGMLFWILCELIVAGARA